LELTLDLLKLILPEFLIDNFDLIKHTKAKQTLHLYFEEKITAPKEFTQQIIIAHGFHKQVIIQNFPLRSNTAYLHVKHRRWMNKTSNEIIQREWELVAQETSMTMEFAAFLKEISQY